MCQFNPPIHGWMSKQTYNHNSKTKDLTPEYFCMVISVGKIYNFYLRVLTLTRTPEWSKWPTCMPSVKTISPKKKTFVGKMPGVKVVALIPTSSKLSLNSLWAIWFTRYIDFPVRVTSDNEILQGLLSSTNLCGPSKWIFNLFSRLGPNVDRFLKFLSVVFCNYKAVQYPEAS